MLAALAKLSLLKPLRSQRDTSAKTDGAAAVDEVFIGAVAGVDPMWAAINARSGQLFDSDGGRDLDLAKQPRTHDRRMFDAAHRLICGTPGSALDTTSARPQVVIGVSSDHLVGADPAGLAEQVGLGLIPDSMLARYLGHSDILAALYDHTGQPLWLGRTRHHASLIQRYALIHQHCEVHHLTPWNAPAKGVAGEKNSVRGEAVPEGEGAQARA